MKTMKMRPIKTAYLVILANIFFACGTIVGNPRQPSEGEANNGNKPNNRLSDLPTIDFEIPSEISQEQIDSSNSGLNLLAQEADADLESMPAWDATNDDGHILRHLARHVTKVKQRLNSLLSTLNQSDELKTNGKLMNFGARKNQNAKIEAIEGNPDFDFKLVACYNNTPYLELKWHSETKAIAATFVSGNALVKNAGERFYTKVELKNSESGREFVLKGSGRPISVDPAGKGDHQTFSYRTTKLADGGLQYRGITSWFDSTVGPVEFEPTRYLAASSNEQGQGEVVGWRSGCSNDFDETNRQNPGWCFGRRINALEAYSESQKVAAMLRLAATGIETQSNLELIDFDKNLTCP